MNLSFKNNQGVVLTHSEWTGGNPSKKTWSKGKEQHCLQFDLFIGIMMMVISGKLDAFPTVDDSAVGGCGQRINYDDGISIAK